MGNSEILELGRLLVDLPVEYRVIRNICIEDYANSYGSLHLEIVLAELTDNSLTERLRGQNVRVMTPEGDMVFSGICTGATVASENGYAELGLEAKGHAWVTDQEPKDRTFQDTGKTLKQVADIVMAGYPVSIQIQQDVPLPQMLTQQQETDWQFLKRIANQCGYLLFADSRAEQVCLSIGVVPFAAGGMDEELADVYYEKDITGYWSIRQNIKPDASAYEFLKTGGSISNLSVGSGYLVTGMIAPMVVTRSEITSQRGVLSNRILLSYVDGAVPETKESFVGRYGDEDSAPSPAGSTGGSYTTVLTGKVLAVSGTDIQVQFDGGEGVRWIPYTHALGNDIYAMPDTGDTVFCYYDNSGEVVALGSRYTDTSSPDFQKPEERSLTANNCLIRLGTEGIDITANRKELDGEGGNQVKIIFSDTEGIDIAATKDITITSEGDLLIQAQDLERVQDNPTGWFDSAFDSNMQKFRSQQQEGSAKYQAEGGNTSYNAGLDLICTIGGNLWEGFVNDISSPFQLVGSFLPGAPKETVEKVTFESVEDKRVMLFGLECVIIGTGDSWIEFGKSYIEIDTPVFQELGFDRKSGYEEVSESQRTGMDVFMDFVQLGLDIAGIFCPVLNFVNAGISLMRGDYYGAVAALIPGGTLLSKGGSLLGKVLPQAEKLINLYNMIKSGADTLLGIKGGIDGFGNIIKSFREKGWAAFGDIETWDSMLAVGRTMQMGISMAKDHYDKKNQKADMDAPDGDTRKDTDGDKADEVLPKPDEGDTLTDANHKDCGDPIDVVTGSQRIRQTDFMVRDVTGNFRIRRYYESIYVNKDSMLGERWFSSLSSHVFIGGDRITVMMPDRHMEEFLRREDGSCVNLRGGDGSCTLTLREDGCELCEKKEGRRYCYDADGRLLYIADRNNNCIRFRYSGKMLTKVEFPGGQVLKFWYEGDRLSSITDIIDRKVSYEYEDGLLTKVTYPNKGTICYTYTPEGYIESITDQNGNQYVRNEYSPDGRVTRQFLCGDSEYVMLYDDSRRVNTFLDVSSQSRTQYYYNRDKLVVKTVYPDGSCEESGYDTRQNRIWESNRRGGQTRRLFDGDGNVTEETLPNGLSTSYEYDNDGHLVREWDNGGREQWREYDYYGNLVRIRRRVEGERIQEFGFSYDTMGRITTITDANGGRTKYTYEGNQAAASTMTTPCGSFYRYVYDEAGRCMRVVTEEGDTQYAYNEMDCCTEVTNPLGETTRYYFDRLCNLIKVVLPNQTGPGGKGLGTVYAYNAFDKLIRTTDALGNVFSTPRDIRQNILKEVHPESYALDGDNGTGIRYEYDTCNRQIKVIFPDGGVERTMYDAAGNITRKISPMEYDPVADDGKGWNYVYDEADRLVEVTDPDGNVQMRYVYDLHGNVVKRIGTAGVLSADNDGERTGELFTYNSLGWITEVREPMKEENGTVWYALFQYHYDAAGNTLEEIRYRDYQTADSEKGAVHIIRYAYDEEGRPVRISDNTGAAVEYTYGSMGQRVTERRRISDSYEQMFVYTYDAAGRLTEVRQSADEKGCGQKMVSVRNEYDRNGNLIRTCLPYGAEIRREYDAADRLISETHFEKGTGIDNTTRFEYDRAGNLVTVTDNLGRKTCMGYDLMNRETRCTERDGGTTLRQYDSNGNMARVIRPNEYAVFGDRAHGTQCVYDRIGRVTTVIGADGRIRETYAYDKAGNLCERLDGKQNGVRYQYDLGGRHTHAETKGRASQCYEYDPMGNITGITDGEGNHTQYILDEWGRIVETCRADGTSEYYSYDYAGNAIKSVDANGNTTLYEYNSSGQLAMMTDPMGNSEYYCYDAGNRLGRIIDRNGTETTYTYNMYESILSRRAKNPAAPETELAETYQYTAEGLLRAAISATGMRYHYEYDVMDRLAAKSASGRELLSYSYDLNGNLVRQKDITKKVTEYTYDVLDLLETVTDNGNRVAEYTYYPDGTVKSMKNGSLYTEYDYDMDRNLTGLRTHLGAEILVDNHYCYDRNGNRTEKRQTGGTTRYTYDALNQLTRVQYPSHTEELYYDRAGNRTRRVSDNIEELYRHDPRNRLTEYTKGGKTTAFAYDRAGNLLSDDKARYTYDAFNRTEKAETFDGHVQVNRYDAEGLRHELEEDGRLVQFIFRGSEVVAEEKEGNVIRFIRGYDLVASDAENARTYYHYASDEMGSITHITEGTDVLNRYEYDAWGNAAVCEETIENRFRFNGQQYDSVTQQYYLRARYYNPVIARFTQVDTYWGDGLNLYAYCGNNPVYYVDPSGYGRKPRQPDPRIKEILERTTAKYNTEENIGHIPTGDDFKTWFNELSEPDLEILMKNTHIRHIIGNKSRLRNGGGKHEWLPVSQAAIAKKWHVTAEQIMEWTTPTATTYFENIVDPKTKKTSSCFHGQDDKSMGINASSYAHKEIIKAMKKCKSLDDYKIWLNDWADQHLALAVDGGNNTITQILALGRDALPEGLRIPRSPDQSDPYADSSNSQSYFNVSPKGDCGS